MKVIKKINNNVAVCLDNNNHELIAFGTGIGFPPTPYVLKDLSKIKRTYYGVDTNYLSLLQDIPEEIFELSAQIVEYAKGKLSLELNPNVVFTLADHISFSLQRYEKKIYVRMPISYDIQYLYQTEMQIGEAAVKFINDKKHVKLGKDEAAGIAMHFINAEMQQKEEYKEVDDEKLIQSITEIIEQEFSLHIDQKSFNYSRFVSHMHYLLKRQHEQIEISSENMKLYVTMKQECLDTYQCAIHIGKYLEEVLHWLPSEEELLYLMLHINRLCTREDCYR